MKMRLQWIVILPLLTLPLVLLSDMLLRGRMFYWGTPALQFIPWRVLAWQMLSEGVLPWWNPLSGMGAPLAANYQLAVFYPPGWLVYVAAAFGGAPWLAWAHSWLVVLHLVWAGLGMALLGRRLGLLPLSQSISALAFAMGGYFVARLGFFSMIWTGVWFPWVVLGASRIACPGITVQKPKAGAVLSLTVALALMLLAGHAQLSWYILMFASAWVFMGGFFEGGMRRAVAASLLLGVAVVAAAALAAVQLLPTAEYLLQSQRSTAVNFDFAMTYSFWPWRLLTFLAPDLFGNPGAGDYWGYATYWEDATYIGMLPILLAFSTLRYILRRGRDGQAAADDPRLLRLLWFVVALSLALALGKNTPLFPFLYHFVPSFNLFHAPARFLIWAVFCLSLLAGMAARSWRAPRQRALYWMRLATASGLAVTVGALLAWQLPGEVQPTFIRATALAGVWAVGCGLLTLFMPAEVQTTRRAVWQWLAIIWLAADLLTTGWRLTPSIEGDFYHPGAIDLTHIRSLQTGKRIYFYGVDEYEIKYRHFLRFDDFYRERDWLQARRILLPNLNLLDRVPSANNYDPMLPGRYTRLMAHLENLDAAARLPWLVLMNVGLEQTAQPGSGLMVRFGEVVGSQRFRWLPCADFVDNDEAAWLHLTSQMAVTSPDAADWRLGVESAPLDGLQAPTKWAQANEYCGQPGRADITIVAENPMELRLKVAAERSGWLFMADSWYPGWQAYLNGEPMPLYRADYLFRAVWLPAGSHEVRIGYQPLSAMVGASISALMLSIVLSSFWVIQKKS